MQTIQATLRGDVTKATVMPAAIIHSCLVAGAIQQKHDHKAINMCLAQENNRAIQIGNALEFAALARITFMNHDISTDRGSNVSSPILFCLVQNNELDSDQASTCDSMIFVIR